MNEPTLKFELSLGIYNTIQTGLQQLGTAVQNASLILQQQVAAQQEPAVADNVAQLFPDTPV